MLSRHSILAVALLLFPRLMPAEEIAPATTVALPADQSAAAWKLPPGFKATLFAGEPAITQPMAFTFDDRGRLWVLECLSYPTWKEAAGEGQDRITILEDTDGDGVHDKRTVFFDKGLNFSSIEYGFGGVWVTAVPNLIFIPDANGDDKPDGPPKVLLDGFDLKARHNVVGNLAWGPDGWLYGLNGILSNSKIGRPGAKDADRVEMNCGVWRYHPVRHKFEAYAHGTTNPWGIDWDERGQMFITNCVIKHIFHVVPGAHFERMFGQDINPHSYGLIQSCADHFHWAGGHWTSSRRGQEANYPAHSDAGGGHAHSGCMIYLGDNWPAEYRGNAFMVNLHGQRLNRDILEREGSGYVAEHGEDFAFSQDPWFRGVAVKYGPDGGVYVADWSDTGECHDYTEEDCDKGGGRIFKIVYRGANPSPPAPLPQGERGGKDLAKLDDAGLVALQLQSNEWLARHARRLLQERAARGKLTDVGIKAAKEMLIRPEYRSRRPDTFAADSVRTLFTWHVTGLLDEPEICQLLEQSPQEEVRAQLALLATDARSPGSSVLESLTRAAASDKSSYVRLHVAAALQRIPLDQRWPIAEALLSHAEDADDANLPLMVWYAVEPLVPHDVRKAIELLPQAKIPLVRQFLTRRIVSVYEGDGQPPASTAWVLDELLRTLAAADDAVRADILQGLADVYRGRRGVKEPAAWGAAYERVSASENPAIKDLAEELAVQFGNRMAISLLQEDLAQTPGNLDRQRRALALLNSRRDPEFAKTLLALIFDLTPGELRRDAICALAAYDNAKIPGALLLAYSELSLEERQDAIQTLTARPEFALALLDAIDKGTIPRQDVSALVIRQLLALETTAVTDRLREVWGEIRPASADKQQRIEEFKTQLTAEVLKAADVSNGRGVFSTRCASCHKLFDAGTKLGPELTGAQRHNLDYVLDNVLDPSAIVPREYRPTVLRLVDGRIVQGVIQEETPQTLVVQTANETIRVPTVDIEARKESGISMMPEGLFDRLSPESIRDLVAYLASKEQVPLPPGFETPGASP
jgi:putative membrane-bound dehydrogenase-like protein